MSSQRRDPKPISMLETEAYPIEVRRHMVFAHRAGLGHSWGVGRIFRYDQLSPTYHDGEVVQRIGYLAAEKDAVFFLPDEWAAAVEWAHPAEFASSKTFTDVVSDLIGWHVAFEAPAGGYHHDHARPCR